MTRDTQDVQVVVMMGGVGSRLGSLVKDTPKPLLPVCGRPFFEYELDLLKAAGFRSFLFLTGYLSSEIEECFGDGKSYGVEIRYRKDGTDENGEPELLGTGGAIRNALDMLEEDFLLVYADSFMDIDYREAVCRYFSEKEKGALSLMTLLHNGGRFDKSNVIWRDGKIVLYDKNDPSPDMDYIDYGVNMFSRSVFDSYSEGAVFDLSEVQHSLSENGRLAGLVVDKRFYEIGRPESYKEFEIYAGERFETARKAAFIDRDGVLNEIVYNEDIEQLDSPLKQDELKIIDGVREAVDDLKAAGYYIFVVTNQPAAAKGKACLCDLYDVNSRLKELIPGIDDIFVCFHHPKGSSRSTEKSLIRKCHCRKPGTGLISQAQSKYLIDMSASFMAGDSFTDIECANAAGLKSVFVGDYKCDVCARLKFEKPDIIAPDLLTAAQMILKEDSIEKREN
ncbi:MAG: HAD-IIIA family hydrolase [Lachnospiraceae bacterium]|nr:HAD-IIIA family hydrolase [Lachnospiraceae bacterium]